MSATTNSPTRERYHSAMERYMAAIGGPEAEALIDARRNPSNPIWRLRDHHVLDVMTREVVSVRADASFKDIVDTIGRHRVGAVPVVDEDNRVIGLVSASDLYAKVVQAQQVGHGLFRPGQVRRAQGETAADVMTAPAVTTTPTTPVVDAARAAAKAKVRRLPVVDSDGRLVGIVTRSDLLRIFLHSDEEIRDHVVEDILVRRFSIDPTTLDVSVDAGIVTISGQVERRLLIGPIVDLVRQIAGVVAVHNQLTYKIDDTITPAPRFMY